MIRLGLCCIFKEEPIKFRTTTATAQGKLSKTEQKRKLEEIILHNAQALYKALEYCYKNNIGSFRVNSQVCPLRTHPKLGYQLQDLPNGEKVMQAFKRCGTFARKNAIRTTFHPDQFVVLSSPHRHVVDSSLAELEYQGEVAEWIHADVINIHGGGAYGDKESALQQFSKSFKRLSTRVRKRLTVENDDKVYTPEDLLPMCKDLKIPLVYDIHHHRCNPDRWKEEEATDRALRTWNREPLFHISSPLEGWKGPKPGRHHDYINLRDFPSIWDELTITVEVEAKAKELAVKNCAVA